jgi:ABC-type Fe3+-hydroxamate transport system substrate-binding protein
MIVPAPAGTFFLFSSHKVMISLFDQTGFPVSIPAPAKRIVSLVPSQTELLFDLGLDDEVAGITRFCIEPQKWFRSKPRIGGTKDVHIEKVAALAPDLILANREENVREQVESLCKICPVWTSDVKELEGALNMIRSVGLLTGKEFEGNALCGEIHDSFNLLSISRDKPTCLYLIWKDPIMTVGGDSFIHDMITRAGFENITAHLSRYPTLDAADLHALKPNYVLLSSEPYPFRDKHLTEFSKIFPNASIQLADGMFFSWYGSRLRGAAAYFSRLRSAMPPIGTGWDGVSV